MTNTERPPTPYPSTHDEPTRKRLSLNLKMSDYDDLVELAGWWHSATIHQAISRAVSVCRRIYAAQNPDVRWAHLEPKDRPLPGYWALHVPQPDGTEKITRLEML
jgi:hypothetical protein